MAASVVVAVMAVALATVELWSSCRLGFAPRAFFGCPQEAEEAADEKRHR
jgi:hypothetical protein